MTDKSFGKYGCYVDNFNGNDGCVFDDGKITDCLIATKLQIEGKGRDDCEYWRPVAQDIATSIADMLFDRLEPEIKQAFALRVLEIASEKWRFWLTGDEKITEYIDAKVEELIVGKYKPIMDAIADKKAREKVLRRAEQNGLPRSLFDDIQ